MNILIVDDEEVNLIWDKYFVLKRITREILLARD